MYRIIIADDEGIVRDSLKFIIEKNFGDECQIAIARNGRQAIELAENFQPDIVLLDIQMPGLNGLKALEEICGQNPKVKALILSAYDNFDYAKEALRLGAVDYLMKPINKKVIVERLTGIMRSIDQDRQKRRDDLQVREKMEAVIPMIENGLILSLIIQNEYEDSGKQYQSLLDLEEDHGIIMVLEWGERGEDGSMGNPVGSGVRAHRYYSRMSELVKQYFHACVSEIMSNKIVCLVPSGEAELEYTDRIRMIEKARNLIAALQNAVGIDFKIGIGSVRPWEEMFESYQEALNALRHGKWKVSHIDDLIVRDVREKQQEAMEQVVLRAVQRGMEHDVRQEAMIFADWVLKNKSCSLEEARLRLMELLLLARRTIQSQGSEFPERRETAAGLLAAGDGEALRRSFVTAMVELAQAVVIRDKKSGDIIARAKKYIRQNFQKSLALEQVAQVAGISPYYFSKVFKEETGMNFSEYLTELRMERAKELLSNPQYSIKQACVEVGYADPNYFSRIFKKCTGITPTEFRDSLQNER